MKYNARSASSQPIYLPSKSYHDTCLCEHLLIFTSNIDFFQHEHDKSILEIKKADTIKASTFYCI